jgi:prevent-host-death family protein
MNRTVSISDAKSHLSEFVGRMMYAGDHIIVERHGKAVAVMMPIEDYMEYEKLKRQQSAGTADRRQEVMQSIVNR